MPKQQVITFLKEAGVPQAFDEIRVGLGVTDDDLTEALRELNESGIAHAPFEPNLCKWSLVPEAVGS